MRVLSADAGAGRLDLLIALDEDDPVSASDSPGLVRSLRGLLPGIDRHRCTSGSSGLLVSEIEQTELAHLLEHVSLELMVLAGASRTVSGRTDWDFGRDGRGMYRVALLGVEPTLAEAAARQAAALLSSLVAGGPSISVEDIVAGLSTVRDGAS